MNTYKAQGVVLKRTNFGEADRLITFYTRFQGKIKALAKGVRRLSSRKRGSLEIFNLVEFLAVKGKGLDLVTEVETLESFSGWRQNLKKVAIAYEFCEMVDRLTVEEAAQREVYDLLVDYLERLSNTAEEQLGELTEKFGRELLIMLGFWPEQKSFPSGFSVTNFIEQVIERELKSKNMIKKL